MPVSASLKAFPKGRHICLSLAPCTFRSFFQERLPGFGSWFFPCLLFLKQVSLGTFGALSILFPFWNLFQVVLISHYCFKWFWCQPSGDTHVKGLLLCCWNRVFVWPVHSLGRTLLAFALLHSVLQCQICLLLQVFLDFLLLIPIPYNEKDIFSGC